MLNSLKWKQVPVFKISLPEEKLCELSVPPEEYLFDRFRIGTNEQDLFSEEAALLLSKIHPIVVWSSNNYCVFGIRTLFILSSIIPTAEITVGVLPSSTPDHEIQKFILADSWITSLAFSKKMPQGSLFEAKTRTQKDLIQALSPALDVKVSDFAKALGVSVPTLYGLRKPIKRPKP